MSDSFLEIIELPNGEYALKHSEAEGEPLVNIRFSEEAKHYLSEASFDIAKVMIQAGVQAVAHMTSGEDVAIEEEGENTPKQRILH